MSFKKNSNAVAGWPQGRLFLGFDVAKAEVVVAAVGKAAGTSPGRALRVANTPEALAAFLDELGPERIRLAAFEPTGGYERVLHAALKAAGRPSPASTRTKLSPSGSCGASKPRPTISMPD